MRSRFLPLAALLILLPACGAGGLVDDFAEDLAGPPRDTAPGPVMNPVEEAFARETLARINDARAEAGVGPLDWDGRAAQAAYEHCVDMRLRGYVGHRNPDGADACERLQAAGVEMRACNENVARGHETPMGVMGSFMLSDNHRATILNRDWTRAGIGVHIGREGPWWTQDFIAPPSGR